MIKTHYSQGILQYLPIFYVIWSDGLISASEVNVVESVLKRDVSLSTKDRDKLISWLHNSTRPSNKDFKNWQRILSKSQVKLMEGETYPLSAFSQKVAKAYYDSYVPNHVLKDIEINLGIQPNHYHHLFDVEVVEQISSSLYNAKTIDALLKGDDANLIDEFRKFLAHDIFDWGIYRIKEDFRNVVLHQIEYLAQHGYGALAYPEAYGGQENMKGYAAIFEQMMYVDGSMTVKFGVQFGLFGGSIQKLGSQKHHDKYLAAAGKAKLLGCFAMTETGHGSNVRGIRTTAVYDKGSNTIIIHTPGETDNKEYIGNALHASIATVFAQLIINGKNEGVHAILVPLRNESHELLEGIRIEDNGYKLGLNGVDNGKIWFHQVRVPRENLLDHYGSILDDGSYFSPIKDPNKRFFTMLGTLVGGRICVARAGLGGAKMALAIAIKYALKRRQFNDNIKIQEDLLMDYPSHQLRLTPYVASAYVYHYTLEALMASYCDPDQPDKRTVETQVAGIKAMVTWFANAAIQECREACGGKGYLLENRIADLKGDVDIFTTFEGDNTVLLQLAAKGVLSDFTSEFNSPGFTTVLRMLSKQINDRMATINPLYANKTAKDHLYNPNFHQHAFRYRRRRLTYTVAMRIRNYIKKGIPAYQAFLKVQTHLIALGKAYSIEFAYTTYIEHLASISDEKYKNLFSQLGTLYALYEIDKDASWFLEQGYIGGSKAKAIRQRVERLSTEMRPHIGTLVDGFGIPGHCMTAPIARDKNS